MLVSIFIAMTWLVDGELEKLRSQYLAAALNKEKLPLFENTCEVTKTNDPASNGYCVMIHFLEAKNSFNPYRKLSEFNHGKKKLDSLIENHNQNIELRYMRHSIQDRVPSFLGYNNQLLEDEKFMSANLDSIADLETYNLIYDYLETIKE